MKLSRGKCRLDTGKKSFTQRVVKRWNGPPQGSGHSTSLFEFEKCSDNALRHMVWFLGCPACGQELDSMILPTLACTYESRSVVLDSLAKLL